MTWQFVLTGLLIGVLVGMTGMGGGSLMTPILVIVFGFKPDARGGDGHRPRRDLQDGRRRPAPPARHRAHRLVGLDVPRQRAVVAARRRRSRRRSSTTTATPTDVDGLHPRRRAALRRRSASCEELPRREGDRGRRPVRHDHARPDRRGRDRRRRRLHRRPDVGRERDVLRADDAVRLPAGAHKVVGTDILHAAALLYVAGSGHFIAGNVDLRAVGWLLIGSIPGVLIGSHCSVRLPEAVLRLALAERAGDQRAEAREGAERVPRRSRSASVGGRRHQRARARAAPLACACAARASCRRRDLAQ